MIAQAGKGWVSPFTLSEPWLSYLKNRRNHPALCGHETRPWAQHSVGTGALGEPWVAAGFALVLSTM